MRDGSGRRAVSDIGWSIILKIWGVRTISNLSAQPRVCSPAMSNEQLSIYEHFLLFSEELYACLFFTRALYPLMLSVGNWGVRSSGVLHMMSHAMSQTHVTSQAQHRVHAPVTRHSRSHFKSETEEGKNGRSTTRASGLIPYAEEGGINGKKAGESAATARTRVGENFSGTGRSKNICTEERKKIAGKTHEQICM